MSEPLANQSPTMFNNIQKQHPTSRTLAFATLFIIPIDFTKATTKDLCEARIIARFAEGLLSEWLMVWDGNAAINRSGKIPKRAGHERWNISKFTYFGTNGHSPYAEHFDLPSGMQFRQSIESYKARRSARQKLSRAAPARIKQIREYDAKTRASLNEEQKQQVRDHQREYYQSLADHEQEKQRDQGRDWIAKNRAYNKEKCRLYYYGLLTPQLKLDLKVKYGIGERGKNNLGKRIKPRQPRAKKQPS
jgi:hypothetical protein